MSGVHASGLKKWWVLACVACGTFMATLDSSIVNIALPTLTKELGADLSQIKWVVIVYLLLVTCLLLPFGRLSDTLGRKRVFLTGYIVFVIGSIFCGFSESLSALILFRGMQGLGASMLMVNGPAIITATFSTKERGGALGVLAMVVSAGLISGPSIGGFLITQLGWRSIFFVNVPIGIIGGSLVYRFVTKEPPCEPVPFDWAGTFLQIILLVLFMVLFDPPHISISGSGLMILPRTIILITALAFGALFIKIESVAKAPVFDLALFQDRTFWSANLAGFLISVAISSVSVLMPFFLEEAMEFPPHLAGLYMTAVPLMIFVVAPISGRLSDRIVGPGLSFSGAAVGAISLFLMAGGVGVGVHEKMNPTFIVILLMMIGVAMGLFQSPNNNAIMTAVPHGKLGVASAFLATARNLGLVIGTGLATGLFTWRMRVTGNFISSLHMAFFVASLIALGGMLVCLWRRAASYDYSET